MVLPTDAGDLFQLGFAHFDSLQAERRKKAHLFFDQAASQGHAKAMRFLGQCFYNGIGVDRSVDDAVHWWREAAKLGDCEAKFQVAEMLLVGDEIPQDLAMASVMLKELSDQHHVRATYHLANMYREGLGLEQNSAKADELMQLMLKQDQELDEYDLATMIDELPSFTNTTTTTTTTISATVPPMPAWAADADD